MADHGQHDFNLKFKVLMLVFDEIQAKTLINVVEQQLNPSMGAWCTDDSPTEPTMCTARGSIRLGVHILNNH